MKMEPTRILYVCTDCAENSPETSGHEEPSDLRILDDGRWLCENCYVDEMNCEAPRWHTLPQPPRYLPETPWDKEAGKVITESTAPLTMLELQKMALKQLTS